MKIIDDNSEETITEDPESDYIIDPISSTKNSLIYALYTKLDLYLHHYNNIQNNCKKLAFTWIIATFIGISYILTGKEKGIPISPLLAVSLLCCLSSAGILLLGFLDTGIYQKMIRAIFLENKLLEEKNPFLGKAYHSMVKLLHKKGDPIVPHASYYSTFIIILLVIAALTGSTYVYSINKVFSFLIILCVILFIIIFKFIHHKITLKSGASHLIKNKKNPS